MRRRTLVGGAVAGHVLLTLGHGAVHATIPLLPGGWKAAYVVVVLYLLPVAGAGLALGGRRAGAWLLAGTGLAGVAFEVTFHFLVANPDHVAHVAGPTLAFGATAVLTTASNLLLVAAGWLAVRSGTESASRRDGLTAD